MKNEEQSKPLNEKDLRQFEGRKSVVGIILSIVLIAGLFGASSYLRKPYEGEGFWLSEASYHVLLTMQAYDEVPSDVHHWLPIMTFADDSNKFIDNGKSLIMDDDGNNYYVSFSPLGFSAPYFFCKLFGLDISIGSLYAFNCVLMIASALLTGCIMYLFFKKAVIFVISAAAYLFLPEVLYTQGIVYWHHSLSQVFLLSQIVLFMLIFIENKNKILLWCLFLAVSFLYPYTEWTGFLSNMGIAIVMLLWDLNVKKDEKGNRNISLPLSDLGKIILLAAVTVAAFGYYIYRFSRISSISQLILTLISRGSYRSHSSIMSLVKGYINSFMPLFAAALLCFVIALIIKSSRQVITKILSDKKAWLMIFMFVFPVLENLAIREHAVEYTFDRLKGSSVLIFIFALTIYALSEKLVKVSRAVAFVSLGFIVIIGMKTYDNGKIVTMEKSEDSVVFRDYLQENYIGNNKNVLVKDGFRAWGYLQMFYHKNIYCTDTYSHEQLRDIASKNGGEYIVTLMDPEQFGDVFCYTNATVEELSTGKVYQLTATDGKVTSEELNNPVLTNTQA